MRLKPRGISTFEVVANMSELYATSPKKGWEAYVEDASDRDGIDSGGALFKYSGTKWLFVAPENQLRNKYIKDVKTIESGNIVTLTHTPDSETLLSHYVLDDDLILSITGTLTGNVFQLEDTADLEGLTFVTTYAYSNAHLPGSNGDLIFDSRPTYDSNNPVTSNGIAERIRESQDYIGDRIVNIGNLNETRTEIYFDYDSNMFDFRPPNSLTELDQSAFTKNLKDKGIDSIEKLARYIDIYDVPTTATSITNLFTIQQVTTLPEKSIYNVNKFYRVTSERMLYACVSDTPTPTSADEIHYIPFGGTAPEIVDILPEPIEELIGREFQIKTTGDILKLMGVLNVDTGETAFYWKRVRTGGTT